MKVKDMIELLKKVDQEANLLVYASDHHGYEEGNDVVAFKAKVVTRHWFLTDDGENCVEICHDPEK